MFPPASDTASSRKGVKWCENGPSPTRSCPEISHELLRWTTASGFINTLLERGVFANLERQQPFQRFEHHAANR